jgi:hypothetical protein
LKEDSTLQSVSCGTETGLLKKTKMVEGLQIVATCEFWNGNRFWHRPAEEKQDCRNLQMVEGLQRLLQWVGCGTETGLRKKSRGQQIVS